MSSYLNQKHSEFIASIPAAPVMSIAHAPSDLQALADHAKEVSHQFLEYLFAITREAQSLNVDVDPMEVTALIRGAIHDSSVIEAIEAHAETMIEDLREQALENA